MPSKKQTQKTRGRPFKKGDKGGPGRKKGVPNKATGEIRKLAQEYGPEAVEKIVSFMRGRAKGLAFAAARELLEWGYTKPKEPGQGGLGPAGLQVIIGTFVQPTALPGPAIGPVIDIKANGHGGNGSKPPA